MVNKIKQYFNHINDVTQTISNVNIDKIIADYLKVKGAKTTLDRFDGSKVARGFYGVKIKEKDKEKIKEK